MMFIKDKTMKAMMKAFMTSTAVCGGMAATMTTGALASDGACEVNNDSGLALKLFEYNSNADTEVTLRNTKVGNYIYLGTAFSFDDSRDPFVADFRVNFDCVPTFVDSEGETVEAAKVSFKVWNEYGTNQSVTVAYDEAVQDYPAFSYGDAAGRGLQILKAGRHSFAIEFKDEDGKRLAGQKRDVIILPIADTEDDRRTFCQRPHLYLTNSGSGYSATRLGKKNKVYLNNGIVRLEENMTIDGTSSGQGWYSSPGAKVPSETLMNVSYDPEYTRFCAEYFTENNPEDNIIDNGSELEEVKIKIWNRGVQYPTGADSTVSDGYFYAGDATTEDEGFRFDQLRLEKEGLADMLYSFQAKLKFADGSEESGKFDTQITTGLDESCYDPEFMGDCGDLAQ